MNKEEKVKMSFSSKEDIRSKTEFLYGRKTPFKYVRTGNSYELYSAVWNCKTFRKGFTPEDLQFIKKVKKYARNPEIIMKYIDTAPKKAEVVKTLRGLSDFYTKHRNVEVAIFAIFVKESVAIDCLKWESDFSYIERTPQVITKVFVNG